MAGQKTAEYSAHPYRNSSAMANVIIQTHHCFSDVKTNNTKRQRCHLQFSPQNGPICPRM